MTAHDTNLIESLLKRNTAADTKAKHENGPVLKTDGIGRIAMLKLNAISKFKNVMFVKFYGLLVSQSPTYCLSSSCFEQLLETKQVFSGQNILPAAHHFRLLTIPSLQIMCFSAPVALHPTHL